MADTRPLARPLSTICTLRLQLPLASSLPLPCAANYTRSLAFQTEAATAASPGTFDPLLFTGGGVLTATSCYHCQEAFLTVAPSNTNTNYKDLVSEAGYS
jgi:hypothetical protein